MVPLIDRTRGPLLAIGGAEDKFRDRAILRRFTELSGGDDARIAIIPTASAIDDAGQRYKAIFLELGATSAEVLFVGDRDDANSDELVSLIEQSTGIFMTGGNQIRVASILGGTRVADMLVRRSREGVPVGGTSAGASVMSAVMVAGGRSGTYPSPTRCRDVAGTRADRLHHHRSAFSRTRPHWPTCHDGQLQSGSARDWHRRRYGSADLAERHA